LIESSFQADPGKVVPYPHYEAPETSMVMHPSCLLG
jgi:hypothetical protein